MLALAFLFSFWGGINKIDRWIEKLFDLPENKTILIMSVLAIFLFILSEANIISSGFNPFIYFKF